MRRSSPASCLAVLILGLFVVPAKADLILSGSFSGDATLTPTGTPGVLTQNFSGDGSDTQLGLFDIQAHSNIDFRHPPSVVLTDGTFTLIFADGTLFGTSTSGSGSASGHGTAHIESHLLFTGGTGNFAGDTGEATIMGTLTLTSASTATLSATYDGSLAVPEPSSLALCILGIATVVGARLRRWKLAAH